MSICRRLRFPDPDFSSKVSFHHLHVCRGVLTSQRNCDYFILPLKREDQKADHLTLHNARNARDPEWSESHPVTYCATISIWRRLSLILRLFVLFCLFVKDLDVQINRLPCQEQSAEATLYCNDPPAPIGRRTGFIGLRKQQQKDADMLVIS